MKRTICEHWASAKSRKRHVCNERCRWTGTECIAHLNRSVPPGLSEPKVQTTRIPCHCGRPYIDHLESRTHNGKLAGVTIKAGDNCSDFVGTGWPTCHLLTCVCSQCVGDAEMVRRATRREYAVA